jgi:hypothetical protein
MCCSRKSIILSCVAAERVLYCSRRLQTSHISLYRHYIGLAKAQQRNFTKILLDQLKIVFVVDYIMVYKIRDIVRISSTKQIKEF